MNTLISISSVRHAHKYVRKKGADDDNTFFTDICVIHNSLNSINYNLHISSLKFNKNRKKNNKNKNS